MSLHEMLRILSITPLEKTPMIQLLPAATQEHFNDKPNRGNMATVYA